MTTDAERKAAADRLQSQAGFKRWLGIAVLVTIVVVVVWALTGQGYFWPGWVMFGLAFGVAANAWGAYGPREKLPTEEEIDAEARKFRDG